MRPAARALRVPRPAGTRLMHAASLDRSARLQRVRAVLADGGWHSTRGIVRDAEVCAVSSCIAELRWQGLVIHCRQGRGADGGRIWEYRMEPRP